MVVLKASRRKMGKKSGFLRLDLTVIALLFLSGGGVMAGSFQIFAKYNGKTFTLDVGSETTVKEVKRKLLWKRCVDPSKWYVLKAYLSSGRQLVDEHTLAESKIQKEQTMFIWASRFNPFSNTLIGESVQGTEHADDLLSGEAIVKSLPQSSRLLRTQMTRGAIELRESIVREIIKYVSESSEGQNSVVQVASSELGIALAGGEFAVLFLPDLAREEADPF